MTAKAIELLGARFPLTALDAGAYASFRAKPLSIHLDWYHAQGLGNVSVLRGKAMLGLMRMDTLVINATERDMPLFSYDFINAMGNLTLLTEYYDTLFAPEAFDAGPLRIVKESISALPDHDLGTHWYDGMKLDPSFAKRAKKDAMPAFETAFIAALTAYLDIAQEKPLLNAEQAQIKREKAAAYVNGLLENGGPSTDAFSKALGKEQTRDLFCRIVFGTEG